MGDACPRCNGTGILVTNPAYPNVTRPCWACGGTGARRVREPRRGR